MVTTCRLSIVGMVLGLMLVTVASGAAAPRVEVDGQPVSFSAAPIQLNNTILVPVRDICRALGAVVHWDAATQTAMATRGARQVQITIGEDSARVDGRIVDLDVPAMFYRGATMVPLAFISKALGAEVRWSEATQTASIFTDGATSDYWPSSLQRLTVPHGTVIPVSLDTALNASTSGARGAFGVTVQSSRNGDAEFPLGTKLVGTVAGMRWADARQTRDRNVRFGEARLPDGSVVALNGSLITLDDSTVVWSPDGRLMATEETLRGGGRSIGASVAQGTELGVLLYRDVNYDAPSAFVSARNAYLARNGAGTDLQTGMQTVVVPTAVVIPVSLDSQLSSTASRVGDGFSATVVSKQDGDAEFPHGTKLVGTIVRLQRAGGGEPGILDLAFREVWLPDGSRATVDGSLMSLDDTSVTRAENGRLTATVKPTRDNRLMFIGIGTGAGLLIGKLLDSNLIVGGLLGAGAGYLYNEFTRDKVSPTDVVVNAGTVFGVRMDQDVSYSASPAYTSARNTYLTQDAPTTDPWSGMRTVVVPEATVIPVSLDTPLSSLTGKVGDGFSVTVQSSQNGDAEFPRGTKLLGTIVGLQKASAGEPGILDVSFREAKLPDGSSAHLEGSVVSLDDKTVTRTADGRLRTTVNVTRDDRLMFIGIGAGAGLLIGKLLDSNLIVGGLLGGAAGYLYNELTRDKAKPTDVVVNAGTVFGVRVDRDVSYSAPSAYAAARIAYLAAH